MNPFVEQMIDRWRQQQSVLAVKSFIVIAVAQGPHVAGDQMLHAVDLGDSARALDRADVVPKLTLTSTGATDPSVDT